MNHSALPLIMLGLALLVSALAIFVFRTPGSDGPRPLTSFCLVTLRLAIGWHFFVEGMDKLHNPAWTGEPYLREATGPFAGHFREVAGDRLVDKLSVGSEGAFPQELDIEWRAYVDAFKGYYDLNADQAKKADEILDQQEAKTKTWLTTTKEVVVKTADYPPPLKVEMTMPERLAEHARLQERVRQIEENELPKYGPESFARYRAAKGDLARWRATLKAGLDKQTRDLKQALREQVLVPIVTADIKSDLPKGKDPLEPLRNVYGTLLLKQAGGAEVKLSPQAMKAFEYGIDTRKDKLDKDELLPEPPRRPMSAWKVLDWSDFFVKWGVTIVGVLLMAGLLTRTACLVGAGLLLSFFLAMPPLPGWPESPRAEGHYLYINKNIIEMLALVTLATTRSGRWAGLDGLLQFLRPSAWKSSPPSSNLEVGERTEGTEKLADAPTLHLGVPETKPGR